MGLSDPQGDGEAESAPGLTGGVEGIKELLLTDGGDTTAVVPYRESCAKGLMGRGAIGRVAFRGHFLLRPEADGNMNGAPSLGKSLQAVLDQNREDMANLFPVSHDEGSGLGQVGRKLYSLWPACPLERQGLAAEFTEINPFVSGADLSQDRKSVV